jgi:tetratricopeptide (TPR) repeat protein
VQLLIHADVGTDYSAAKPVSIGYVITDKNGRIVDSLSEDARLPPTMIGVPSPLQFVSTASLEPGDYGLKMSVVEGDRVGTVEHVFHAGLAAAGSVALSDLMVGGPATTTGDLEAPTVGYTVNFGTVHGYLEAYGPGSDSVTVKYEVAASESGAEPLLQADALGRTAGEQRMVFSNTLSVGRLPPGQYFLRAVVSSGAQPVKTMARAFEVAPAPVLMTSADNAAVASTTTDVYLPVADTAFLRAFRREDAARGDTLRLFRESVTPASRDAFDKGAASLSSGDYPNAEQSFKTAIRADDQSSVALAYLAATYAAAGHDTEAAGAWQTSLIDGSEFPQIYEWLGDTLLRQHDLSGAKTLLEEAAVKWPADLRFAKPIALVYATFGQGVQAVRMLTRHLSAHGDDVEALSLGVEWIYHLHSAGAAAQTLAEDAKLARVWADAYLNAKGPQAALVKQWMQALEAR